ncbi:hypothetical protein Rhal01_03843 [Rubritalea halochordaticola]|uniref:DUF1963 domain-containing protein n=1 Tax=Rubritalea halochordaticola TaxID=714537 RepID=A0ABP9VAI9_9BACT
MNLAIADLTHTFIKYLRSYPVTGVSAAYEDYRSNPEAQEITRHFIQEYKQRSGPDSQDLWDNVSEEVMQVLLWRTATIHNSDPLTKLQDKLERDTQFLKEHADKPSPHYSHSPLCNIVSMARPFPLDFFPAWQNMTDEFKKMLEESLGTQVPDCIGSLESFLWLSSLELAIPARDEDIIASYQSLTADESDRLAAIAISQYESWTKLGMVKGIRCANIDDFIPIWLSRLTCFSKPLSAENLRHAQSLEYLSYRQLITHKGDPGSAMIRRSGEETVIAPYLREGLTLVPADSGPSPITAGHGKPLQTPDGTTLLTMLDIDLTSPDLAFLGLAGTRLRFCYPAEPEEFDPFFTRVTLNGGVSLFDSNFPTPNPENDYQPGSPLTSGRPLLSPCEGLDELDDIGAIDRLGGLPSQRCEPYYPESPVSGKLMTFIAQFPHPAEGRLYTFLDKENLIAATVWEYE